MYNIMSRTRLKELFPANQSPALTEVPAEVSGLGEGGEGGRLEAGKSVTFAILEVVVCVLVRHFPDISPRAAQSSSVIAMQVSRGTGHQGYYQDTLSLSGSESCEVKDRIRIISRAGGIGVHNSGDPRPAAQPVFTSR